MNTETQLLTLPNISRRVIAARESAAMSQAALSKKLGFKDRQTLAAIEAGQRKVTIEELLALMDATGKDMEFFTDPFRVVGEAGFSYRASGPSEIEVEQFEEQVGGWLALWRFLGEKRGDEPGPLRPRLAINEKSTFEDAQTAGEQVARELKLGQIPAEKLTEAIEAEFSILVLSSDMPEGVSGVAVQLASGDAILTNRNEPPARRAFDLAHELFHVLTWDALPPERVDRENPTSYKAKRTEQLADNFAGALLIPSEDLRKRWEARDSQIIVKDWLQNTATHFQVSSPALFWRMVALSLIKKDDAENILPKQTKQDTPNPPPLFSRRFLDRVVWGVDHGHVSVRRVLKLLDLEIDDFRSQCAANGVAVEIGL